MEEYLWNDFTSVSCITNTIHPFILSLTHSFTHLFINHEIFIGFLLYLRHWIRSWWCKAGKSKHFPYLLSPVVWWMMPSKHRQGGVSRGQEACLHLDGEERRPGEMSSSMKHQVGRPRRQESKGVSVSCKGDSKYKELELQKRNACWWYYSLSEPN